MSSDNKRKGNPKFKVVGFNLTHEEHILFKEICVKEYRSMSDQLRKWIKEYGGKNK